MTPDRISCPFRLCGAYPQVLNGGTPDSTLIEKHKLPSLYPGAPVSDCPASLQRYPVTAQTRERLEQMEGAYPTHRPDPQTGHYESPFKGPRMKEPFSISGRGSPKLPPKDLGWQLGGRDDEDARPLTKDVRGKIPLTTEGYPIGRAMATANELAAKINSAGAQGAEAASSIFTAKEAIGRATGMYLEANSESETLRNAVAAMSRAVEHLNKALDQINVAAEHGAAYSARLFM